ncbi:MAG: exodeoxyribonuclease VII small subunit [Pseudomonadota bacterium]
MPSDTQAPVEKLSFEDALSELETVVSALEKGSVPLEQSILLYERGAALRAHCETKLKEAEAKVTQITEGQDGSVTAKEVDLA